MRLVKRLAESFKFFQELGVVGGVSLAGTLARHWRRSGDQEMVVGFGWQVMMGRGI